MNKLSLNFRLTKFRTLLNRNNHIKIDYFAISLPDLMIWDKDLVIQNHVHCRYITALGLLGSGRINEAEKEYDVILNLDKSHQGAILHRKMIMTLSSLFPDFK